MQPELQKKLQLQLQSAAAKSAADCKDHQQQFFHRLLSFPTNLINASDTRRGLAKAFGMWSDVSPFTFREVPADEEADIKIGGCEAGNCRL